MIEGARHLVVVWRVGDVAAQGSGLLVATWRGVLVSTALLAAVAVLVLSGCARHDESPAGEEAEPVAVSLVPTSVAGAATLAVLPARVEAREEVTVLAKIAARLSRFAFAEGDAFPRGAVLAEFDASGTRESVAAAKAAVAAAAQRRDVARLQEARMDSLFASRVATRHELEITQSALRAAEADLAGTEAQLAGWTADTQVKAPFDGVVVRRHVDTGATVQSGQPLLDLRSKEPGRVVAQVPESLVGSLEGARFDVQVGHAAWREARLERMDGMTDYATRSRSARFSLVDAAPLDPGAFARVRVGAAAGVGTVPGESTLRVPTSSLVRRGALQGVYVVRDGHAAIRWLRLGREEGGTVDVLAGLAPDDLVIASPEGLADGRAVQVAP